MKKNNPNILILFTDQQRFDTIAACGNRHMVTPNLDRLVREGCWFSNAYTPNPVCVPARHNLLTGLPARYHGYSSNNGHPFDYRLPTLPRILSDSGYDTRAIGKMHFRPPRRHNGFNKMELMEEIPGFREMDEYALYLKSVGLGNIRNIHGVRNLLYMVPQQSLIPEEHHGSTWVGNRSMEYLKANRGSRPFFLWSSWIAPHPPFDVPHSFAELYCNTDLPEPFISETPLSFAAECSIRHFDCPEGKKDRYLRRMRELYYSAISLVDKNIGNILKVLEDIGQLDNTMIIFTSDHGEMLGDHNCFQKMLPYDSCSRIPMIVRYPRMVKPGSIRTEFVDLNDILPTILDAVGIDYPDLYKLPGGSLFRDDKDRSFQYIEYASGHKRWISINDGKHKYNYYYGNGFEELFDLVHDPCEKDNLMLSNSGNDSVIDIRNRLKAQLYTYEERWGLENYAENGEFLKFILPNKGSLRKNGQFQSFPERLPENEQENMNDFGQEVITAVKDETIVKLHELNLEDWRKNGAPQKVIEKISREKL